MANNFLEQFRKIVGTYSLCALKCDDKGWECSLYDGGRRMGSASHIYSQNPMFESLTVAVFNSVDEKEKMAKWADQAGPLGFESIEEFLETVVSYLITLRKIDHLVRKQEKLVAVSLDWIDPHGMPISFVCSKNKVNEAWIKGYVKTHKTETVINGMWN